MNSLVQLTLDAHGGLERWRRFEHVAAHLRNDGVLWALKHQQGVLDDVHVRVALRREWASHSPFVEPDWRTSFEPHRVAIETTDGRIIEERLTPRDTFAGHGLDTIDRVLRSVSFGGGAINQTNVFLFIETMPYGGVGTSGIGHYYGKYGFDAMTHAKSILVSPADVTIEHLFPPYTDAKVKAFAHWFDY